MPLYWTDANVLLRFLTGEPEQLADRSAALLEKSERGELGLRIHPVVVAEVVWVLESFYGYSKDQIRESLLPLLEGHRLRVEGGSAAIQALQTMAEQNVDYADALLAELARERSEGVASFDKDFRKRGIEWHEPG